MLDINLYSFVKNFVNNFVRHIISIICVNLPRMLHGGGDGQQPIENFQILGSVFYVSSRSNLISILQQLQQLFFVLFYTFLIFHDML